MDGFAPALAAESRARAGQAQGFPRVPATPSCSCLCTPTSQGHLAKSTFCSSQRSFLPQCDI